MTVHTRWLTECQMHLGNSWSGQNLQISVSLDAGDGGKVSLAKTESRQCKFCKTPVLGRKKKGLEHAFQNLQWAQSPGLKSLVRRATSRRKLRVTRARKNMVAVQITKLDQNAKEVDPLKFSKEHHWVFAWRWIVCIHCHLQTLGRIFEEIFKWVAVQKCLLGQIGKIGVELKISNGQKVSLHKNDVETSHDIPKFWWNF